MRTLLIIYISFLLWQVQGGSKKPSKPRGLAQPRMRPANTSDSKDNETVQHSYRQSPYKSSLLFNARKRDFDPKEAFQNYAPQPMKFAVRHKNERTSVTTTTKKYFDNDCDYTEYYCLKGFDTGKLCGKTLYNTYDDFDSYCQMEYINCLENYDLWSIAHMGICYNVSSFQTFAYYAYAVWDDQQLEEMYIMPAVG